MLRKDRTVQIMRKGDKSRFLLWNKGVYPIGPQDINLSAYPNIPNPTPEIVFYDENPQAIGSKTEPIDHFDRGLIENFVQAAASVNSPWMMMLADLIGHPAKLIVIVFAFIILIAFLSGQIGAIFKPF